VLAESTGSIPVGRYGKPEEYGDVVAFLCSERAAYMTGSIIRVDGGLITSI
jgi:3-oxoacyl-[acyl-carrier protein] reductase